MLKDAVKFTNKIKNFDEILSVVLFGSVARGDFDKYSDVDIAIIYSRKNPEIIQKINLLAPEKFQVLHLTLDELVDEPTLAGALSGEGILLHGKPVTLSIEDEDLKSQMIIAYDTTDLKRNIRSKLYRTLYGGSSTYYVGGVKKKKKYPGIIERITAKKLAKSVILVDRHNAPEIIKTLRRFNAKWKEIPVWTY